MRKVKKIILAVIVLMVGFGVWKLTQKIRGAKAAKDQPEDEGRDLDPVVAERSLAHHLIFILLPVKEGHGTQAQLTVESLARRARFPKSLILGVSQVVRQGTKPATHAQTWSALGDRLGLTVRWVEDTQAAGPGPARRQLLRGVFLEETYVLATRAGVLYTENWDEELLESLQAAHAQGAHAVTQFPGVIQRRKPPNPAPGTFPAVARLGRTGVPRLRTRFMPSVLTKTIPSLWATPDCFFYQTIPTKARDWGWQGEERGGPHFQEALPLTGGHRDPWFLSLELYLKGYQVVLPHRLVLWRPGVFQGRQERGRTTRDLSGLEALTADCERTLHLAKSTRPGDQPPRWLRSLGSLERLEKFFKLVGVHPAERTLSRQARLGLVSSGPDDAAGSLEVIQKFGSWSDFLLAQESLFGLR